MEYNETDYLVKRNIELMLEVIDLEERHLVLWFVIAYLSSIFLVTIYYIT